jgi:hypothetical protein
MCPGTHTSWILLFSFSFIRDWWQSQTNLEFILKLSRALMAVGKNIDVFTHVALFYIIHYSSLNGVYCISAWSTVVWNPQLKLFSLLEPHLYTPAPVPLLVLYPSTYQTRHPLLCGLNLFFQSCLSGNLTMNDLWYTNLRRILSDPIVWMGSCPISRDSLGWPKLVDLGLHCWVHISLQSSVQASASVIVCRGEVSEGPPLLVLGSSSSLPV